MAWPERVGPYSCFDNGLGKNRFLYIRQPEWHAWPVSQGDNLKDPTGRGFFMVSTLGRWSQWLPQGPEG
jgi:hypothetical protein